MWIAGHLMLRELGQVPVVHDLGTLVLLGLLSSIEPPFVELTATAATQMDADRRRDLRSNCQEISTEAARIPDKKRAPALAFAFVRMRGNTAGCLTSNTGGSSASAPPIERSHRCVLRSR